MTDLQKEEESRNAEDPASRAECRNPDGVGVRSEARTNAELTSTRTLSKEGRHLKRYGMAWFCGVAGVTLAVFGGYWAMTHETVREAPEVEMPLPCVEAPLIVPPFQVMNEEGMCLAAEKMVEKLLELQTRKYAELTGLLRFVQDANSAEVVVIQCALRLRDVDNIDTVLHRCCLSPQAHQRMSAAVKHNREKRLEYDSERSRVLEVASSNDGLDVLAGYLQGKWDYRYYSPEDLLCLMADTREYLEKVNEELKAVVVGKESYAQAAAAFAERRAVPDAATIELVIRWADAGRMNMPQQQAEEHLMKGVLQTLNSSENRNSYGKSVERLLYLRRIRSIAGEHVLMKDWVDTYAGLLLPLELMLAKDCKAPTAESRLDLLISMYDTLLMRCETLPQKEDSEEMPEDIRTLYGQILYQRMQLKKYLEISSSHESCLLRLLLSRMEQFAAYRCDKRVELASIATNTLDMLSEYESFKVSDNESQEDAVPPMLLMSQMLYAAQLSREQRALEALRDISGKKSADAAAELCAESLLIRRICSVLRGGLSLSPEEKSEVMREVGNEAEMWASALDAELERFRELPNAARGSEKLAEVLSGVGAPAVENDNLEDLLATTELLLTYMISDLRGESGPAPAAFHKRYFFMVAALAQRWVQLEYQQPMSRAQLEMYEKSLERMVGMLKPLVQRYLEFEEFADSLGTCARLLPPVRRAIAQELLDAADLRYVNVEQAKADADEILATLQEISNAESARAVLPKLRHCAERFRTRQMDNLEFFSQVDGLMWPDVLRLRMLHHEIKQASAALRAANNCYGCPELDCLLKEIEQVWVPNLSADRPSGKN